MYTNSFDSAQDNTQVIAVFKRNRQLFFGNYLWNFLGKYRVHDGVIRDLIFGPATSNSVVPRLFSLGEDKNLIEYDLEDRYGKQFFLTIQVCIITFCTLKWTVS